MMIFMDFFEIVKERHSVRSFKEGKEVPDEVVLELLELAIRAPSAGNAQSWEFIIVKDQNKKNKLAEAALNQDFIACGSHLIIACANQELSSKIYGNRGWDLYSICETSAAIMILLLAAANVNLGACWVGAFKDSEVREILNIPKGVKPIALIPIGYPKDIVKKGPARKDLKEKLHYGEY
ncbi:MAG: nitroreductase family protein [Candidatus Lokiarchaeota archaeon]|nr:nitroreductase family protein [Candidatus Lokiarchaeota archaeon]